MFWKRRVKPNYKKLFREKMDEVAKLRFANARLETEKHGLETLINTQGNTIDKLIEHLEEIGKQYEQNGQLESLIAESVGNRVSEMSAV